MISDGNRNPAKAELETAGTRRERRGLISPPSPPAPRMRQCNSPHVTVYRWVQRFTPLLADAAGPCRHAVGDRWFVDETYVKVAGDWRYV
jgi:hypothetical protein